MALASTDIRKILTYSTISQTGLMFLACGIGAFDTAIFHLSIHAYAKVLLFFCAGNIMYTLQIGADLAETGGLKNKVPSIFRAFMIGTLTLSGIPFMSGFFSHDAILWKTLISHPLGGFIFGLLTLLINGITVFYLFRMLYK